MKSHKEMHEELHNYFDILVADFINHTGKLPSDTTILELMSWSHEQTMDPTEEEE